MARGAVRDLGVLKAASCALGSGRKAPPGGQQEAAEPPDCRMGRDSASWELERRPEREVGRRPGAGAASVPVCASPGGTVTPLCTHLCGVSTDRETLTNRVQGEHRGRPPGPRPPRPHSSRGPDFTLTLSLVSFTPQTSFRAGC